MIRVLLVDDHRLIREALAEVLSKETDVEVVGEAGDAASAQASVAALQPDLVLLDIGLPDMNGVELAGWLHARYPALRIVALSAYAQNSFVTEMLRAGASGYLTKSAAGAELMVALRAVMEGRTYLCSEVAADMVAGLRPSAAGARNGLGGPVRLGRRETEVLRRIALGQRSQTIAEDMNIALSTVEVHRRNIMRKLGVHSVAELTRYAIREGLVTP